MSDSRSLYLKNRFSWIGVKFMFYFHTWIDISINLITILLLYAKIRHCLYSKRNYKKTIMQFHSPAPLPLHSNTIFVVDNRIFFSSSFGYWLQTVRHIFNHNFTEIDFIFLWMSIIYTCTLYSLYIIKR
jgi:hypothetical protein